VTVQTCYSSLWTLLSSLVVSEGWLVYWRDRFSSMLGLVFRIRTENNRTPVLKTEINGRGDPLRWPRNTLYPQKLTLTSLTSGGRSFGIVRLRTTSRGDIKQLPCFVYIQFGWPEGDQVTTGGKSEVFRRCEFCFVDMRSCHKVSSGGCSWALNWST
jgi:hypothetical protein